MKTKYVPSIFVGLIIVLLSGSVFQAAPVRAQTLQYWSDPINLSHSGSSTDPSIVIDSDGMIHVIWVDAIDGYKYVESADGKVWTSAELANFPFLPEDNPRPRFFVGAKGVVYIFWQDEDNALYYGTTQSEYLGNSSSWRQRSKVADAVVDYHAVVDSQGTLHLAYVKNLGEGSKPAGVYYSRVRSFGAPKTKNIYSSEYFRSLDSTSAHVRLALSNNKNPAAVYIAWDARPQKRLFLAKSADEGDTWNEPSQILGPEALTGIATAFNVEIGVINNQVLLTWQIGQPGEQCAQYSQWSIDAGEQFGQAVKVSDQFPVCPQSTDLIPLSENFSVELVHVLDDMVLAAWNGSGWSEIQSQNEIAAFFNPATLDSVIFSCQKVAVHNSTLYVVGCDKGTGGDIWFSTRSLGTTDDWFPPASEWSAPAEIVSVDQKISSLSTVADRENNVHVFWVQTPQDSQTKGLGAIQHLRWNGESWSAPMAIVSQLEGTPMQLNVEADSLDRLLLAWVDSKTGDICFSSADSGQANNPAGWQTSQDVPSASEANSSPDILVDGQGRIVVIYAIPINEQRGIYFVESEDGGLTWTQPFQVFDATTAGWEIVDQPDLTLTGDGRLHIVFKKYALQGQERQSLGFYYSQSADGGLAWTNPEPVSEQAVLWSAIAGYDTSTVHRMWMESQDSMFVTFHQVSQDSGLTWSSPAVVSSSKVNIAPVEIVDPAGNVHLLQLDSRDTLLVFDKMRNGSGWISQTTKELYINDRGVPSSIAAAITSKGQLLASLTLNFPFLTGEFKNNILSMGKSLDLSKDIPAPSAAMIPTAGPTPLMTAETPDLLVSTTSESPLAGVKDAPSFLSGKKNLIGFILLAGILVLVVFVFRPGSRKQHPPKETAR